MSTSDKYKTLRKKFFGGAAMTGGDAGETTPYKVSFSGSSDLRVQDGIASEDIVHRNSAGSEDAAMVINFGNPNYKETEVKADTNNY